MYLVGYHQIPSAEFLTVGTAVRGSPSSKEPFPFETELCKGRPWAEKRGDGTLEGNNGSIAS